VFPGVKIQDLQSLASSFGGLSMSCVWLIRVGDVGGDLVEPVLSLSFGLVEWGLLLRSSRKERESEERSCREAHDGDCGWRWEVVETKVDVEVEVGVAGIGYKARC